jgi:hypothetical protein
VAQEEGENIKRGKTVMTKRQGQIIAFGILLLILLVAVDWLVDHHFESVRLIAISAVAITFIVFTLSQTLRRKAIRALNLVGEDESSIKARPAWHFLLVSFMLFIVCFYILLGNSQVHVSPVLQFNIIIVSSTLGGLVLAAATISRNNKAERRELLSVAQKLIAATILFVFATALLFLCGLTTTIGWFYNICFWLTVICFFPGVGLFSIGIIDLVIALNHVRQKLSK